MFSDLYPAVKLFFVLERANGRYVDREDLVMEFEYFLRKVFARLEVSKARVGLSMCEQRRYDTLSLKLPNIHKKTVRRYWGYRLSQVCAARLLKPQRLLTFTLDEEKKRVFEYWKDWEMRFGHLSWEKIIEGASSSNDLLECPGNFAAPD